MVAAAVVVVAVWHGETHVIMKHAQGMT
jgi:hypothetical protein